ncbi:MAG: metallophosphoesterase [Desulfovibrionales bacterium]
MSNPFWIGIGDIHENIGNIGKIPGIERAEGILISGDLTNRGSRKSAERILDVVSQYNATIFAQIGNMDGQDVARLLDERGMNVHARSRDLGHGVGLMGVGYSTPTPFGTPSEVSEEQIGQWLDRLAGETDRFEHLLLMVHTPPQGTLTDRLGNGQSVGSAAVRSFIETHHPEVCLTGHIHEARAIDSIASTRIVNPGMFGSGGYALITLEAERLKAELQMV